jgi:hypothetical protein
MSTRTSGSEAGFTLVEAVIAMVILLVGIMAIANLNLVAASSNMVANQSTAAADRASETIELLKSLPFDDPGLVAGGNLDPYNPVGGYGASTVLAGVGQIRVAWQVDDIDGCAKAIRVRAEGTGVFSRSRSRAEFHTLRSCTTPQSGCSTGC